jgi:hypothetical protein
MDHLTDIEVEEALLQIQRRKTALELRDLDHQERLILLRSAKKDNRPFIKSELTAAQFIDLTSDSEESMVKKENPPDQRLVKVDDTEEKPHLPESTPATRTTASTPTNERIESDNRTESQILLDTCLQQSVPEQENGRMQPDPNSESQVQTVVPAAEPISEPDVQTDEPQVAIAAAQPAGRRSTTRLRAVRGRGQGQGRTIRAASTSQTPSRRDRTVPAPTPTPRTRAKRQRKAPSDRETEYRNTTPTPAHQGTDHGDTEYYPNPSTAAPASNPAPNHPIPKKQQEINDDAADLNENLSIYDATSSRKRPRLPPNYYKEDLALSEAELQGLLSRYCRHALQDVLESTAGGSTGGDNVDPDVVGAFNDAFNAAWTKLDRCDFSDIDKFVMHMMQIIHQMMPPTAPGPASQANTSSITRLARSRQILLRWHADWSKCLVWCEHNGETEAERLQAVDRWVNDGEGKDSA